MHIDKICLENLIIILKYLDNKSIINLYKTGKLYNNMIENQIILIKKYCLTKIIGQFLVSKNLVNKFLNDRNDIKLALFSRDVKQSELSIYFCYKEYINKIGVPNHINITLASIPYNDNTPRQKIIKKCYINKNKIINILFNRLKLGFVPIKNLSYNHPNINLRPWTRP